MREHFGGAYDDDASQTGMFLPTKVLGLRSVECARKDRVAEAGWRRMRR
jgi:hypothetical protein